MRLIWLALLLPLVSAIGIETISINGSNYFWVNGTGSISPFMLLNRSSGNSQWSTSETYNLSDALARQSWLKYGIGFFRRAANNQFLGVGVSNLPDFNTYGYSDNLTYWRTESNKTSNLPNGLPATIRLTHTQTEPDDYVNMTIRYDTTANYVGLADFYFMLMIQNITRFDRINYDNGTHLKDMPLNASFNQTNVSYIMIYGNQSPPSWQYRLENASNTLLTVNNGTIWIGYNLGRRINGSFQRTFQAIDANPCNWGCDVGDAVSVNYVTVIDPSPAQLPFNLTCSAWWTDILGTCSLTYCFLGIQATSPYNKTGLIQGWSVVNNSHYTPAGSNWVTCNTDDAANNCTAANGNYFTAAKADPVKDFHYLFNVSVVGRYNFSFGQQLRSCIMDTGANDCPAGGSASLADPILPLNTQAMNISYCQINGADIANNTANTVYASNGSLAYANVTLACYYNYPIGYSYSSASVRGLVNVSHFQLNRTTEWNYSNVVDNVYAVHSENYIALNSTYMYKLCVVVNSTNKITNNTCYQFNLNIVPVPNPPGIKPSIIAQPFWRSQELKPDEEMDTVIKHNFGFTLLLLIPLVVAGAALAYYKL